MTPIQEQSSRLSLIDSTPAAQIKARALELGFDKVGVVRAEPLSAERERLEEWLRRGYQGEMAWMARDPEQRADPRKLFPNTRSVIVAALNSLPGIRCANPGGAFYTFPNVEGTGYSARDLQGELLDKAGVATIAGTSFGAFGENYLRFSYANSLEAITEAIERIRNFLGNLPHKN